MLGRLKLKGTIDVVVARIEASEVASAVVALAREVEFSCGSTVATEDEDGGARDTFSEAKGGVLGFAAEGDEVGALEDDAEKVPGSVVAAELLEMTADADEVA